MKKLTFLLPILFLFGCASTEIETPYDPVEAVSSDFRINQAPRPRGPSSSPDHYFRNCPTTEKNYYSKTSYFCR